MTSRLYEVRLAGEHSVFVLATDHITALSLAMVSRPIKLDDSVAVSVVKNFLMAPSSSTGIPPRDTGRSWM